MAGWYGCGAGRDDTPGVGSGVGVPRPRLPMLPMLLILFMLLPGVSIRSGGRRGLLGEADSGDGLMLWNAPGSCCCGGPAIVDGMGGGRVEAAVIGGGGADVV